MKKAIVFIVALLIAAPAAAQTLLYEEHDRISGDTISVALPSDTLMTLWVSTSKGTGVGVSGGGCGTWAEEADASANARTLHVFSCVSPAASGNITVSWSGGTMIAHIVLLSHPGATEVVNEVSENWQTLSTGRTTNTSLSISGASEIVAGIMAGTDGNISSTCDELDQGTVRKMTMRVDSCDSDSVSWSWSPAAHWLGVAIEVDSGAEAPQPCEEASKLWLEVLKLRREIASLRGG